MIHNKVLNNLWLIVPAIISLLVLPGMNMSYSQPLSTATNVTSPEQHAEHIIYNLVISEHIPLTGQLAIGDYILLMDFTPFVTSIASY